MRVVSSFLPQNLITEIELYVDDSKKIKVNRGAIIPCGIMT